MTEKRVALIVGTDEYQDPDLKTLVSPSRVAEALAKVLGDPRIGGFEVQMLLNQPSHKINEKIEAFFSDLKVNDLSLLYLSCHGIKDDFGNLYFAACNTESKLIQSTSVSSNFVNSILEESISNRSIIILDCCYSGTYIKTGSIICCKRDQSRIRNRVILTSSNPIQYSFETNTSNGITPNSSFTQQLTKGILTGSADLNRDGMISCVELYQYVKQRMKRIMSFQTPQIMRSGESSHDITIAKNHKLNIESNPGNYSAVCANPCK